MMVDRKMLPMKVHYFVRFAGTGPLTPFLSVIARQKGVSEKAVGVVWTVLPFVSLVTKTSVGAIADWLRAHRAVFFGGIVVMLSALTALYWVPDVPTHCSNTTLVQHLADSATSRTSITSQGSPAVDDSVPTSITYGSQGDPGDGGADTVAGPDLPVSGGGRNDSGGHLSVGPPAARCSSSPSSHIVHLSGGELVARYEFWLLFVCLLLQYCSHITVITMQETVCFQMLGEASHKYGEQRLWGTVGWGITAVASGALVDWYSKGLLQKDYLPAHVLTIVFLVVDLVVVARLKFTIPDKKMSPTALHGALWRPNVLLILVSLVVIGTTCGLLWTFQLLLVEDVAHQWDPQFPHIRLLQGLIQGVQCFLAEVPFFFLAGRIIKRIGHANALFISLVGFAIRLCVFASITNPWWFLPADILHGISFGIAYPCFTSYASVVSPKGAKATTQAIFGAAFFGGSGLGGLVGGWLFQELGGRRAFLTMGVFNGVYAAVFMCLHTLITHMCPTDAHHGEDSKEAVKGDEVVKGEEAVKEEAALKGEEAREDGVKEGRDEEEVGMEAVSLVERQPRVVPSGRSQMT